MPTRYQASVTLLVSAAEMADHVPSWWGGELEPIDEVSCRYRTGDDNLGWLATRIVMLGVDFVVDEPPELIEHVRALGARLERATV